MYEIIRQVIANGGYKLAEMQQKIKRMYVLGDLTDAQLDELLSMANAGATADAERPETLQMLMSLAARMEAAEARLTALEGGAQQDGWPEWKPWDGVSMDYKPGAIVRHAGKLWKSVFSGQNVWEPGAVSEALWIEYTE